MKAISKMLVIATAVFVSSISSASETSPIDQIRASTVFASPLQSFGPPSSEVEANALLSALKSFDGGNSKAGFAALEKFLSKYPKSVWGSSLRVNMAEYYRAHGRYSLALGHWEKAWEDSKNSSDPAERQLAVRSFAGWTRLLGSLGDTVRLAGLYQELDRLRMPLGSYSTVVYGTREGLVTMKARPGNAYRCGSYALANMARAMNLDPELIRKLSRTDSPDGGFRMSELLVLAETNGLAVQAVRRPHGGEIVVPSVVHWKLNHYAAIVDHKDGRYKVSDPTFRSHVWMDLETIEAEASGAFLVRATNAPAQWTSLSPSECASIFGKGGPNEHEDEEDEGPCDCPPCDEDEEESDPPAANDGPGDGNEENAVCPPPDIGMPVWRVSEPSTTLWIVDTPLFYRNSYGKLEKLQLRYKQRGEKKGETIGCFGPRWECNFIAFLQYNSATPDGYQNHKGGGGIGWASGSPDYKNQRVFTEKPLYMGPGAASGGSGAGFAAIGNAPASLAPSGAELRYQFLAPFGTGTGITNYFLTHRVDRYGRASFWNYQTIGTMVRLTNVVDRDGKAFVLSYTNSVFTNQITSVKDPYDRMAHFIYNANGLLTNIVDMAGMSSSFEYDTNFWITSMTTPYGITTFEHLMGDSTNYLLDGEPTTRRCLRITEPTGDKQLYSYCDNGPEGGGIVITGTGLST